MLDLSVLATKLALAAARPKPDPKVLVCFSHLRWDFVYQRPQHLLSRAAEDYAVVFMEEPVFDASSEPMLVSAQRGSVLVVTPHLPADRRNRNADDEQRGLLSFLLDELLTIVPMAKLVFWYYTPMALGFSAGFDPDLCVYDCMDELSAFRGAPPEMLAHEQALLEQADLVFTGGQSLYEMKRGRHSDVHLFPSSIDREHFVRARVWNGDEPPGQAAIPHPRIGFFGVIDERMDTELVAAIAERAPHWQLVMIGPVVKIDPATLPRRPNIHWIGARDYRDLPSYLAGWDLGFMPFALNEATRFISPTKTPEFLAAGLPLISTAVADVVRPYGENGLVRIVQTAEEAVEVGSALMQEDRSKWIEAVDQFLLTTSWDATWAAMDELIGTKLAESGTWIILGDQSISESLEVFSRV